MIETMRMIMQDVMEDLTHLEHDLMMTTSTKDD